MTAQISENLLYQGKEHAMAASPLEEYFYLTAIVPRFARLCTALWRGYTGNWEVVENRLYLVDLQGTLEGGAEATVASFFPDYTDRVFAHWYSGTIRLPQGKLLEYVHMGYASTYECDLYLEVEKGVIRNTKICHNGIAAEDAPEGYGVAGMTFFGRN